MRRLLALLLAAALGCAAFTGCQSAQAAQGSPDKLIVAYMPNEETTEIVDAKNGFAKQLSQELGIEVVELSVNDYNAAIEAMRTGQADMAFMGALSFCIAYERADAIPLAMLAEDGDKSQATYTSLLVARADNDEINSIADVKGKSIAFADPNSTSANLIPSAEIMKAFEDENLTMEDLHTNGAFCETSIYSGSDLAGMLAVDMGDVDLAAVGDMSLQRTIDSGEVAEGDLKVVHVSAPIPSSCMAIRSDYPQELREKIEAFLLSYDDPVYFKNVMDGENKRFVPCTVEDYEGIIELNKKLNPTE